MRFTHAGEGRIVRHAAQLAVVGVLALAPAALAADAQSAVWATRQLTFVYQGFTTHYSCDALQARMRDILVELGARADLEVLPYGCTNVTTPDPFAGVRIRMKVLQPAVGAGPGAPIVAQWKEVDLANRDPETAARECELLDQVGRKILPLFATRNLQQVSDCQYHNITPGSTRLRVEVLVADPGNAASAKR